MISVNGIEYLKTIAELQVNFVPGGVMYLIIEEDVITWRKSSDHFDLDLFHVRETIKSNSIAAKSMRENQSLIENIPRALYGVRLRTVVQPIVNEDGKAVGAFSIIFPRLHPIAASFPVFAPLLAEMFPEGSLLYMTDLHKIIHRHASKKFDVPTLPLGYAMEKEDVSFRVIQGKQQISEEMHSKLIQVPVLITCFPLFDDENPNEIVATLGVIIPKAASYTLRNMSANLENGVTGIAAAIEELAASAMTIHANEQDLNNEIKQITALSDEINKVTTFIKEIADETKMLGLNASIEAARAGETGRGFSVVAAEIRKLSEQSKSTVPKIQQLTDKIKSTVEETGVKSQLSLTSSQEQAAATEEITASVEELTSMSVELHRLSQDL